MLGGELPRGGGIFAEGADELRAAIASAPLPALLPLALRFVRGVPHGRAGVEMDFIADQACDANLRDGGERERERERERTAKQHIYIYKLGKKRRKKKSHSIKFDKSI